MSSQSSRWTDSRCTLTPGRESSAATRPGSSAGALRECGHQPPSTAPCRWSAGSKLTRGAGGPPRIAEGGLTVPPGGMGAARVRLAEPLADGGCRVPLVPWCGAAGAGMRFLLSRTGAVRGGAARRRAVAGAKRRRAGRASVRPPRRTRLPRSVPGWWPPARCDPGGSRRGRDCRRPVARSPAAPPSSSSRARASLSAASTSREVKALTMSPSRYPGGARSGPATGSGHRPASTDTRHPEHQQRHEHNGDDDRADENHRPLPSDDPG